MEGNNKSKVHFVEYLRSIFGNDEEINSLTDLRSMLEEQLRDSSNASKTDVDHYYEVAMGVKKKKIQSLLKGEEEESKGVPIPSSISYLDKCKRVGKLGPLNCKMNLKDAFGNFISQGR